MEDLQTSEPSSGNMSLGNFSSLLAFENRLAPQETGIQCAHLRRYLKECQKSQGTVLYEHHRTQGCQQGKIAQDSTPFAHDVKLVDP